MNAKLSQFQRLLIVTPCVLFGALGNTEASTAIWSYRILFNEFESQPGGWENEGFGTHLYNVAGTPSATDTTPRGYDFLRPTGTHAATGKTIYGKGQDGIPDLTIRSQVINGNGGRWTLLSADKTADDLRGSAIVEQNKSRPNDFGIVVYELSFNPELQITAQDLNIRLSNVNSFGELYQWTFATVGDLNSAPFDVSQVGQYRNTDYSDLTGSNFYDADGNPTGNPGTGALLPTGRSMSQFLAGLPSADPSGGVVQPGWFAVDDFHVIFNDGPEDNFLNPKAGLPGLPDTLFVNGERSLGMAPDAIVTDLTLWFGFTDVGFDTNGDGFTKTGATMRALLPFMDIGSRDFTPVPEPGTAVFGLLAAGCLLWRRRR